MSRVERAGLKAAQVLDPACFNGGFAAWEDSGSSGGMTTAGGTIVVFSG